MHSGLWGVKYQCSECDKNPKLKDVWGCEKNTQMAKPTFEEMVSGVHYVYKRCPRKFVPASVAYFSNVYAWYLSYPSGAPKFKEASDRYLMAKRYYEEHLSQCKQKAAENV